MHLISSRLRPRYRVLAVSDRVEPRCYGPNVRKFGDRVDFIVGCGDLPYYYLEYMVSTLNKPLVYVHGNHDHPEHRADRTVVTEPPGGVDLHLRVYHLDGLLLAGLEGSHRYNNNPRYQYTQMHMLRLVLSMAPSLLLNRLLYGRFLDVLVAHSPPYGIHDATDRPHIGFRAFLLLLRWFKPRYMLHGHQHVYDHRQPTRTRVGHTDVINVYPLRIVELKFDQE